MKNRYALLVVLLPLLLSGCFKTRAEIAKEREEAEVRNSLQQNIADNSQGLEKIQNDIGSLQGRVEEIEHQRKKEIAGLSATRESDMKALKKSLDELEAKLSSVQNAQNTLFEEIKMLKEEGLQAASERAKPAKAGAVPGKKKPGLSNFDSALSLYKAKDFQNAADGFRTYIAANPKGKHTLEAQYFLGDSLFSEQDFSQAVVAFGVVHEKSPASALGRKSTLRIAQSFKAMGKDKDAKAFALLLVQSSPGSDEAKKARKLLK